jgi:hypothetical protein
LQSNVECVPIGWHKADVVVRKNEALIGYNQILNIIFLLAGICGADKALIGCSQMSNVFPLAGTRQVLLYIKMKL